MPARQQRRRQTKISPAVAALNFGAVGRQAASLRHGDEGAGRPLRDDVIEQSGAVAEQGRSQSGGVILRGDAPFPPGNDRPGVHPLVQEHHADAGDRIAGQQRAGDGRRPPVARQQGRVQVEAAQPGPGQNGRRQQPSVGGHDNEVGGKGVQFRHGVRVAEAWRLPYGNAQS